MGWFWSSLSNNNNDKPSSTKKPEDPLSTLDADLSSYLTSKTNTPTEKAKWASAEASIAAEPALLAAREQEEKERKRQEEEAEKAKKSAEEDGEKKEEEFKPPPFANPRYAHLWKTYKPPSTGLGPGDDGLLSNIQQFKSRSARLGKAALENCAEFELAVQECYRNRNRIYSGETMITGFCAPEIEALQKCGDIQIGLLKGLGFMDAVGREVGEEELDRLQIAADRIFQEWYQEEKRKKEERDRLEKEGKEVKGEVGESREGGVLDVKKAAEAFKKEKERE